MGSLRSSPAAAGPAPSRTTSRSWPTVASWRSASSNTESEQFFGIGAAAEVFGADGTWESSSFGTARLLLNAYRAIAPDPDGGAVMAGYAQRCTTATDPCENLSPGFFMISKALADGSPDTTFDDDGVVITWMAQGGGFANGVALQPDGKIVAVGPVTDARGEPPDRGRPLPPERRARSSFGTDGRVLLPGGTANDVEVSDDGTIVIAGNASPTGFLVVRLLDDGTPDPGFGDGDGIVMGMTGRNAGANDLALAPGRKIVVGGMVEKTDPVLGTVRGFGVMRLTSSGEPDPRFNERRSGRHVRRGWLGMGRRARRHARNGRSSVAAGSVSFATRREGYATPRSAGTVVQSTRG